MPPKPPQTWSDNNPSFPVSGARMAYNEERTTQAQEEAEAAGDVSLYKYGVKLTASGATNTKGVNEAIVALPATGGRLVFPEPGLYNFGTAGKNEPINAEKRSGIILAGSSGVSAGGGLGYPKGGEPAVNFPATYLAYAGNGPAFINAKKTTGFGLENLEVYAYKKKFGEEAAYVVDLSESNFMYTNNATIECSGEAGEIIPAKCLRLDNSNCGQFIRTWIKGGKDGVVGRLVGGGGDFSYAHQWVGGGFVAQSNKSVLNPHNGWCFTDVAFEPHYSSASVEEGAGGGWIGPSAVNMEAIGLVLNACFFGATPGKESGNAIEFLGNGLTITGGEISCCENAIVIPQKSSNITLTPHINLCVNGLVIAAEGKETNRIYYRPSFGERFGKTAITPYVLTGKPKGAVLQGTAGNEFKAISTTLGSLANTEARVKELTELTKSLGFSE